MIAIWTACILSVLFTIYAPVYPTIAALCTMFLYLSYLLPVAAGLLADRRSWNAMGSFDLGLDYRVVAVLCIVGCAVRISIGIQPPNDQALTVTLIAFLVPAALWFGFERRHFAGPPIGEATNARRAASASAEKAVGEA